MSLLRVNNIFKSFGKVNAVNGLSLDIKQGTCQGLLGPNGAGKTTTIEMMEGIKKPTSGEVLYKQKKLAKDFRNEAGIMFQSTALQEFITGYESLKMFSRLYPKTRSIDELVEQCELSEFLHRDTRKLSGGQRQRLLLAISLINDPDIIFLDEPTTGLDPQSRRKMWELLQTVKAEGKTILLTTHYMDEAYQLCDDIAIMDHGKLIAQGSPDDLLKKYFDDVVLQIPFADVPETGKKVLGEYHEKNDQAILSTSEPDEMIKKLLEHGATLRNLQIRSRNLDDLFLELTGKELRA